MYDRQLGEKPGNRETGFRSVINRTDHLIATVGFYEHTCDWLYTSGIPAKTGVGGGVMGVLPGVFGIAAFAPPLDDAGNSVKAQAAIKYITQKLGLNVFNGNSVEIVK